MIKIRLVGRASRGARPGTAAPARPAAACWASWRNTSSSSSRVGDTFAFAGEVLRFEGLQETEALVSRTSDPDPMIPSYDGGKFPLSTHLAERVRRMLADARPVARAARPRSANGWAAGRALRHSRCRRGAGRDVPARQPPLPGRLSLRGPARPPDARHAADAPARSRRRRARSASSPTTMRWRCGASATWPRCMRRRPARPRRAVRRGHAGRRPRRLARRNRA